MRWSIRAIGLVNIVILARLLTPEDFGLIAMSMMALALLETFGNLGVDALIIRERKINNALINTAWTMQFLQNLAIAGLLIAFTPLIAGYFKEPRIAEIIYVLSIATVIKGLTNIGMTLVRRELDYAKDFRFEVYIKLSIFISTLTLAIILQSYWAIAFGQLIGAITQVILSYLMHPYRPRPQLHDVKRLLHFGFIINLTNIFMHLNGRIDSWVVSGISSASVFGIYNIALELSRMSIGEISGPVNRALFPAYAKIAHDKEALTNIYLRTLGIITTLCFALGAGMHVVASDAVIVILGDQWLDAIPIIQWLALLAIFEGVFLTLTGNVLNVIHQEKTGLYVRIGRFLFVAPATIAAGVYGDVMTIAITVTIATAAYLPITAIVAARIFDVSLLTITNFFWRPIIASILMAVSVKFLHLDSIPHILSLFLDILVGAVTYPTILVVLWLLVGRPDGVEKMIIEKIRERVQAARK